MKYKTLLIICCLLQFSCASNKIQVERAFYYWKNNEYSLNKDELKQIQELKITKLYVKFFEIEKDPTFNNRPVSKSDLHFWGTYDSCEADSNGYYHTVPNPSLNEIMDNLEIIPTIYIKNEVLSGVTQDVVDTLAGNIVYYIDKTFTRNINEKRRHYNEIQIDCDWTETTKANYFLLLECLKKRSAKIISCTLRLYPYKYRQKMGVPPVGKVTLMCYNLIPPLSKEDENSIQNNRELELYLKGTKKYPIHLDIALPVYSWVYIYQNNQFKGVINWDTTQIKMSALKSVKPLWYEVQEDLQIDDFYLRKGDKIKLEETTPEETLKSISLLKKYLHLDEKTTISLFHLDSKNIQQYNYETLHSFYTHFN